MNKWADAEVKDSHVRKILKDVLLKLEGDQKIDGIFLRSSYAMGVVTSQSDLDIGVIGKGRPRRETWTHYEIPVHIHYFSRKIISIIRKDEKDPEFLLYLPLIKSFGNIIPLSDKKGVISSLQQEVLKRNLLFAKFHVNEMGKQLNDAYGLFKKGAYEDAVLNIRKVTAEGVLAFLSIAGMPSAKEKYIFSLLSSSEINDKKLQNCGEEILHLLRKIHDLKVCDEDVTTRYLLHAGRMFQILSKILEESMKIQ